MMAIWRDGHLVRRRGNTSPPPLVFGPNSEFCGLRQASDIPLFTQDFNHPRVDGIILTIIGRTLGGRYRLSRGASRLPPRPAEPWPTIESAMRQHAGNGRHQHRRRQPETPGSNRIWCGILRP
jgi:hypothetical protein